MKLIVKNLKKSYSRKELFQNLSFSFSNGILQIEGKSGSGKTTLLFILRKILVPDEGTVNYESAIQYGFAGQTPSLFSTLSYQENKKKRKTTHDEDIENVLFKSLDFSKTDSNKKLFELSGGERKKAELIFALSQKKDIYFLDEPFSSLDQESKTNLTNFLNEFSKRHPLIIVTHESTQLNITKKISLPFKRDNKQTYEESNSLQNKRKDCLPRESAFLVIGDYFRSKGIYSFIKRLLSCLFFVFFSLGFSFTNTRNDMENQITSLKSNPYSYFEVLPASKNPLSESYFSYPLHQVLTLDANMGNFQYQKIMVISGFTKEEGICHFPIDSAESSLFSSSAEILFYHSGKSYSFKEISKKELSERIGNGFQLFDKYRKNKTYSDILLTSNDFIDSILRYSPSDLYWSNRKCRLNSLPIVTINNDALSLSYSSSLPFSVSENTDSAISCPLFSSSLDLYENNEIIEEKIPCVSSKDNIMVPLNLYKDFLLHSKSYSGYQNVLDKKDAIIRSKEMKVLIQETIVYLPETRKQILYFSLSIVCLGLYIIFVLYSSKGIESWKEERKSILQVNQRKGYSIGARIISGIETLPFLLSSVLLYYFVFIPLANISNRKNTYPFGYTILGEAYNNRKPVPFIHFEALYWIVLLFFLLFFLLSFFYLLNKKKKH